jgi:hypothetical protein
MRLTLAFICASIATSIFVLPAVAAELPQGFVEGTYTGSSKCALSRESYTCQDTFVFKKYSIAQKYDCSNGESGFDGIEFKLNQSTGELEAAERPNFKLHCEQGHCVISNSDAPEYADKYSFSGDQLVTSSICQSASSDETAPYTGEYHRIESFDSRKD